MKKLLLLALLAATPALAEDPKLTALLKQGDAEERLGHTRAALNCFRAAEQLNPQHVGALLRISKQYSDLIATTQPPSAAEQLARRALQYSQRAVELEPKTAKAHLSVAIACGKLTDFVGNKEKLEYSKIIKGEAQKSIALDPTDDYAWHVLGRWHSGVANVGGVLKLMAKVVYGGMPSASNEEAARCLLKASELAPRRIIHHSELARVYQLMGKKALAKKEWESVLALPAVDREDLKDQADARAALGFGTPAPAVKAGVTK